MLRNLVFVRYKLAGATNRIQINGDNVNTHFGIISVQMVRFEVLFLNISFEMEDR